MRATWGTSGNKCQTLFFWAPKSLQIVIAAMKLKDAYSLEVVMTNLDSIVKCRNITLSKSPSRQGYGFPVVMYGFESGSVKKAEH